MDCTVDHTHDHLRSPCPYFQSVELGVPWLPVRFHSATNSRNICYLDCYPIVSQRDGSHLNLCLYWQTCLLSKCCFWWISRKVPVSSLCRKLIKQRYFFSFFLAKDRPGFTWTELASVFCSSAFLCSRRYSRWPAWWYIPDRWQCLCYSSVRQLECSLRDVKSL